MNRLRNKVWTQQEDQRRDTASGMRAYEEDLMAKTMDNRFVKVLCMMDEYVPELWTLISDFAGRPSAVESSFADLTMLQAQTNDTGGVQSQHWNKE